MNKIVKLCSSCDEGFAQEFDLCPSCGSKLNAFRFAPVEEDHPPSDIPEVPTETAGRYSVTLIADNHLGTRNALFAGALFFVVTALMTGLVVNLFSKDIGVGSINDDVFDAVIVDELGEPVEKAPESQTDAGKGGGGGGGNNDPIPASKGDRAPMRLNPEFAPSVTMDRLTSPTIPIQMAIKGPINEKLDTTRYGVKLGGDTPSDGPGTGGGQGPGRNLGQGPGDGPGYGPGDKGGLGGGPHGSLPKTPYDPDGDGQPPGVRGITTALKILSKPRPSFTDEARQNGIQGEVILRVTFMSNGTVGNITAVKGLPNGLTEQAIQAARRITFEPATINGKAQSVTKQIEYSFYIY